MAVLPRSSIRLLSKERPEPFRGVVRLEWSYRDQSRQDQTLRMTLDTRARTLRVDQSGKHHTLTLEASAISNDVASATTSIDVPGLLTATLDSTSGRCLFAQSDKLAEIDADHGRSRAVSSYVHPPHG